MDPTFTMLERVLAAAGKQLQAYSAAMPDGPALARLVDAYDAHAPGTKIDWVRLRGFLDWLELHPELMEEAIEMPPPRTGTVMDALLAGIAEKVSADHRLVAPRWARAVPPLKEAWSPPGTPRMISTAEKDTPEPFRRRRIVLAAQDLWRSRA